MTVARATYYRHLLASKKSINEAMLQPKRPVNIAKMQEKQQTLDLLHSAPFVDKTPYYVYHKMLDAGIVCCSSRTMYRRLAEAGETTDRRRQRSHRNAIKPELIAIRPNEVWCWDITRIPGAKTMAPYHLYTVEDIRSRYIVGWLIAERESGALASKLIRACALREGIQLHQLTLHSDNGPAMKSEDLKTLLDYLKIDKTHNRPYVSDDNPFIEAFFKTLKYHPDYLSRFKSLAHAEAFCRQFFHWYNTEHYHSGIAWLTPASVHFQIHQVILQQRYNVLIQAYLENPKRFGYRKPQLKTLARAVYINPPQADKTKKAIEQLETCMAHNDDMRLLPDAAFIALTVGEPDRVSVEF